MIQKESLILYFYCLWGLWNLIAKEIKKVKKTWFISDDPFIFDDVEDSFPRKKKEKFYQKG